MPQSDLRKARRHLESLREVLADERAPRLATAAAIELLCGSMARLLADCLWQSGVMELRACSRELHEPEQQPRRAYVSMDRGDFLRLQLFKTVNRLENRLDTLQNIRRAGRTQSAA